jgi:CRISPR-associated protein Csd1
MMLQALKEYYDRKAADAESDIPPDGFERKAIPFLVVIDRNGKFINLEDTREQTEKTFLVPRSKPRSGSRSYETTFLLWDHIGYVLQYPNDEKAKNQHNTWLKLLNELSIRLKEERSIQAIIKFYDSGGIAKVMSHPSWNNCRGIISCNMTFKIAGEIMPVPCCQAIKDYLNDIKDSSDSAEKNDGNKIIGRCLISGEIDEIVRVHSDTRITKDAKKLVGFQKNSGFDSYGKEQGYNAPVGKAAEFAYTTALNTLLRSETRMQIGDAITVCWSEKKSDLENQMPNFFNEPPKDDPDLGVKAVESLFKSIKNGALFTDENDKNKFFVLGLSPNVARIAVRFWVVDTVAGMAGRISSISKIPKLSHPRTVKTTGPNG